ncbi:macrolide 2'-phosphotransferase [Leptolyngbya sp. FACHB-261]|uniref:macrolide 2'-phosphotransferase n=1 Tax=Leptolyngbya sp. FACHB-261 TaxID=2692806 RepID=UPI00168546A0|nr:macrolide 2'-phosphotransferase [Leptolyngbya sp. FACHB-261]MBD2099957.1 macrolide 2'-phosphotransferase [Leptolyngbya sp. FACHB-261]
MIKETKSKQEVLELAHKHDLTIQENSLQFNESGLDFQVVLATDADGERWILRLPRREDVLPSVDKEKRTLKLIAPLLSVEVPRWTVCTDELIAYRALNGVPTGTIDSEAKAYVWEIDAANPPDQFHESLAKGIASLHQVSIVEAQAIGLPVETPEQARAAMKQKVDAVKNEFGVGEQLWNRWQSWLQKDEVWPKETVLTHGDLHAGHILIDAQVRVTGFIDWTEAAVTDPACDFVAHYRTSGENALNKLISAYAKAGGCVWPKMAEHVIELAASYPIAIAEFALKSGLDEYKQMARQLLGVSDSE